MTGLIQFEIDTKLFNAVFDDLPKATRKASVTTLNKVGRLANREASGFIKSNYNIKARDLRIGHRIRLRRANLRGNINFFLITVIQSARGLFLYGARQTRIGTRVRVSKTAKTIRGAFISVWRKGSANRFVFLRDKRLGTYTKPLKRGGASKPRERRRALFGPSIADLYRSRKVEKVIDKTVDNNFQNILDEEFSKEFEKRR